MKYPFKYLKIKYLEIISLKNLEEEIKRRKRGEILHLTLSFVKNWEDFKKLSLFIKKALFILGEKYFNWDLEKSFIKPLEKLLSLPQLKLFFPSLEEKVEVLLKERALLFKGSTFRPDRIIVYPEKTIVVEFKTYYPGVQKDVNLLEDYRKQVKTYTEAVFQIFKKPTYGFLLFIETPKIEEVCFYDR